MMSLIRLYKGCGNEATQENNDALVLSRLQQSCPQVVALKVEKCYYIQTSPRRCAKDSQDPLELALGEAGAKQMRDILGDPWLDNLNLYEQSQLQLQKPLQIIVEIGPRLNFTTAWSTNAVSICHACGLSNVVRLERAHRYLIEADCEFSDDLRKQVIAAIHDPMTQQEYPSPLTTFELNHKLDSWSQVDVLGLGRKAMEEINSSMGLAFDSWDIDYYTSLFKNKIKRNPTTVELFDLAQSNSEHSRHWFFKGEYIVDGQKLPCSLLDLVMATNSQRYTNQNNVIAFSDNSSGVKGWKTSALVVSDPGHSSRYLLRPCLRHLIFTAETHNFPTGVAPFSGATTGTGGRIRDVQAAGRGGHVIAGTAGYCFGNLHIPGYELPWEIPAEYPTNFATPLEVAIEASNGASDYGNKFGEPVLAGFARSFGLILGEGQASERREWIKPIMFSGGMGTLDDDMISKKLPEKGLLVVKLGGPVYRIGVGGGAASSVQVQGDNTAARDLGAVQRGDAEMEQKLNRVIRGCLEMQSNPILAIHDQGAGGNANVLKELMEGAGGVIFSKSFSVGDPTLSTLEVWGAEYQESNAILTHPDHLSALTRLVTRERCPMDVVGVITGDQKVRLVEEELDLDALHMIGTSGDEMHPVDLHLDWVLGKMPKKVFQWTKEHAKLVPLKFPENLSAEAALERVLKLPSVASKRYLTNKVDRSVTGLVAQQQCVGPLHTPLADVAVTAHSYFQKEGTATSIGEQPIKMLVDPAAGARLTVLEALANLAAAPITDLKDVKCSANWMWAAKLSGEGWALYKACEAMCDIMKSLGIAVDGGKDSLSMAARVSDGAGKSTVVKAPGALVVSAYAPCPDITKVVTPDLKCPGLGVTGGLLWVRPVPAHTRLAGSALAQVYSQLGSCSPDVEQHEIETFVTAFNLIQELIKERAILSLHDVSDGGLITCLLEMGVAGWGGFSVDIPPAPAPTLDNPDDSPPILSALFSEEIGWVMEVAGEKEEDVLQRFHDAGVPGTCPLGVTTGNGSDAEIVIKLDGREIINMNVGKAAMLWEETSYQLEKRQMNPDCARSEYEGLLTRKHTSYHVPFAYNDFVIDIEKRCLSEVRVALIREEGTNGDREMAAALIYAGFTVYDVTMTDILDGQVKLDNYRGMVFPGGFSYADVLGSGVGWAASICGREDVRRGLEAWRQRSDTFSLGVCNGCQLMALLGWLNPKDKKSEIPSVRLTENISGRFESRWSRVRIESCNAVLLKDMDGAKLGVWVAHGEGRFVYQTDDVYTALQSSSAIALRYIDDSDIPTEEYPMNPNGSRGGVAGITSACGRHLAIMPHPERCILKWQWPYLTKPLLDAPDCEKMSSPWSKLFQNGFDWCIEC